MMKYLILLLTIFMISCGSEHTPKKQTPTTSNGGTVNTESSTFVPGDPNSCVCPTIVFPVCAGGITYTNLCKAQCAGHQTWSTGACNNPGACVCTMDYNPVCANGVTYSNGCSAECQGHRTYTQGACGSN